MCRDVKDKMEGDIEVSRDHTCSWRRKGNFRLCLTGNIKIAIWSVWKTLLKIAYPVLYLGQPEYNFGQLCWQEVSIEWCVFQCCYYTIHNVKPLWKWLHMQLLVNTHIFMRMCRCVTTVEHCHGNWMNLCAGVKLKVMTIIFMAWV